jgi:hypothetical protein
MILERFIKQPAEVKDYDVRYADWLDPMADTIDDASAVVVCTTNPQDTSLVVDRIDVADKAIKLWVSGGTNQQKYKVTIQVTTFGGRLDESELVFSVRDF